MSVIDRIKQLDEKRASFVVTLSVLDGTEIKSYAEAKNFFTDDLRIVEEDLVKMIDELFEKQSKYNKDAELELKRSQESIKNMLE